MPNQDIIKEYVENNPDKLGGDSGCFTYQEVLAIAKTILNASGPGKEYATLKFLQKYCDICGDKNAADFTEFQHGDPRNYGKLLNVKNDWEFSHSGKGVAAVKSENTNNQQSRNEEDCNLMALIYKIRTAIKEQRLKTELQSIIHQLSILGHEFDFDTFPPLENKDKFNTDIGDSPKSLAEALLWKLGKWKTYSNFVAYY